MRTLLLGLVTATGLLAPSLAEADQCQWVTKSQAVSGSRELGKSFGARVMKFCEPCGDTAATPVTVKAVSFAWADDSHQYFEVKVNGDAVDLAYTYVKIDTDADQQLDTWQNLAQAVGCPAEDVTNQFALADIPGAGGAKSDEADEDFTDVSASSGGCSSTHGSSGALVLGAFGMMLAAGRRRRRA